MFQYIIENGADAHNLLLLADAGNDNLTRKVLVNGVNFPTDIFPAQQAVVFQDVIWISNALYDGTVKASPLVYLAYISPLDTVNP